MEILLDGRDIPDRKVLHDLLAEKFQFPDYYGRNLDALYDLLTAFPESIRVTVMRPQCALSHEVRRRGL